LSFLHKRKSYLASGCCLLASGCSLLARAICLTFRKSQLPGASGQQQKIRNPQPATLKYKPDKKICHRGCKQKGVNAI
jgi:hypothetical protein